MKRYIYALRSTLMLLVAFVAMGCTEDEVADYRETDYGYVQFKLYKEASFEESSPASRALKSELDYLSEATKLKVTLSYGETTIAQTLTLSAADAQSAEYGLRSEKLKLLTGAYQVVAFMLYDADDEPIYNGVPRHGSDFEVTLSGLTMCDLTVDVQPRGQVRFTLKKDLSDFEGTRAPVREYTFSEVERVNITVQNKRSNEQTTFEGLETRFEIHFNDDDQVEDYIQTSSLMCDTVLMLKAGDYRILSYETFDGSKALLETKNNPKQADFTVVDNQLTEAAVPVTLYEADEYIQDYYALKTIWEALDGPNWYYGGENFPRGSNWNFNKDIDLWGDQPGVQIHPNGRVARLDLSDFAFAGPMPEALGQLDAMVELYLGTHNDVNLFTYDPSLALDQSLAERSRNRMENHKKYLSMIHPAQQLSEPCARALAEKGISTPATALYETMSEHEIFNMATGEQRIRPMDTNHGVLCNGLESLPASIGNLKNLEYLNIANSAIKELPEELKELTSLTDLEIYNCPNLTKFPMMVAELPELVSLNISNNLQWDENEIFKGLEALAASETGNKNLQILYCRQNNLKLVPATFSNLARIGLLDLAYNKIEGFENDEGWGLGVAPIQLYLDNNRLTHLPKNKADGHFCFYDDIETFSCNYNQLTKMPNIFSAESVYTMTSVSFNYNQISGFEDEEIEGGYKGLRVETFSLAHNPLKKYPVALAKSNSAINYLIARGCEIDEIPEGSFTYDAAIQMNSLDLTYNDLTDLPREFHAGNMPYFYGLDISFNSFSEFPYEAFDCAGLTVFAIRSQRDQQGKRCLRQWPTGVYQHTGLRGLYLGSNDIREVDDTISTLIYYLDISDNPNIVFDASDICYSWYNGAYILIYDKTQNIINCDYMLE